MVYHAALNRFVLFGGVTVSTSWGGAYWDERWHDDTWLFDPSGLTWTEAGSSDHPSARSGHSMAYHAASGLVVLFGGGQFSGYPARSWYNDTWVYNLTAAAWSRMTPTVSPSPQADAPMVYEPASQRMILRGGYGPNVFFNETWAYDLAADSWTRLSTDEGFLLRMGANAMAYHDASGRIVAIEGLGQTWVYEPGSNNWTKRGEAGPFPNLRLWTSLVDDRRDGRMVLYGGNSGLHVDCFGGCPPTIFNYNDTWAYDVERDMWTQMRPAVNPGPRRAHSMTYHDPTGKVVLFGGALDGCPFVNDEMWVYDLAWNAWTSIGPPPRRLPSTPDMSWAGASSDGSVEVHWGPPRSEGASPLVGYRLYWIERFRWQTAALSDWAWVEVGEVGSQTLTGLTADVEYMFQVTAVNGEGEGPPSCGALATPQSVPDPPAPPPPPFLLYSALVGIGAVASLTVFLFVYQRRGRRKTAKGAPWPVRSPTRYVWREKGLMAVRDVSGQLTAYSPQPH